MIRGFVYSALAIIAFLVLGILWMMGQSYDSDALTRAGGWLLILCAFVVGPCFFAIGYFHHRKLNPDAPKWDSELNE